MTRLLAVAHQTAETDEFLEAVRSAAASDCEVVLLIPATPVKHLTSWTSGESRAIAREKADAVRRLLEGSGVTVTDARVGDPDPYQAILDVVAMDDFDRVIVSTFPPGISRWLGADLVNRLGRSLDMPITHIVAH
jgi:nucleotide-binding universal stress UspA family protein